MEIERPHRTTSTPTTSELFICFTSRLTNSSSRRLTRDRSATAAALTTSLSRRLRRNGSLRGGSHSPALFPNTITKKNRGSSVFAGENPEPSSPKVTCIGQVRVKTKKQGKKIKFRACGSKRIGGDLSFGRIKQRSSSSEGIVLSSNDSNPNHDPLPSHRNQRWVHLPLTICETLKGFGSDFSCLLPCKSSCFSNNDSDYNSTDSLMRPSYNNNNDEMIEERGNNGSGSSCGGVFRWLVSLQEGEGERRDTELVVDDDDVEERERVMERECSRRRSIFDDMEFDDLFCNDNNNVGRNCDGDKNDECGGEIGGRISVCVPPKNALLLMRCRSDPNRMASLSRKFMEDPIVAEEDGVEVKEEGVVEVKEEGVVEVKEEEDCVRVEEELEVREEEVVESKGEGGEEVDEVVLSHFPIKGLEVREEEVLEIEEESGELNEVIEGVDEICEGLEVGQVKVEEVAVSSEGLEERTEVDEGGKQEESEVMRVEEEIVEEVGVEVKGEEEENGGIENRDETEKEQGVGVENGKENGEETEDEQSVENSEKKELVLENVEETRLMEGENVMNECLIGASMVEENVVNECSIEANAVEEGENGQDLVEMLENQVMQVLEERMKEESCELAADTSSNSCTTSNESKELDPKQVSVEVEKELVEEVQETRKSMEEENKPTLPDCLLLMMCEPKLSMKVSKETCICSTDFEQWLPERHHSKKPNKSDVTDGQSSISNNNGYPTDRQSSISNKKAKPAAVAAHLPMPPVGHLGKPGIKPDRSSISFPAGGGLVANLIEHKVAKSGVGYEPFMLPRCKSAPMRSTAKFALSELACSMWGRENSRKIELHRPATCGVGAGGVGF